MIENLNEQLNLNERIHALLGDLETLLETVEDLLVVPGGFTVSGLAGAGPEEMTDGEDPAALVGLLEEVGGGQGALGPERGVVLL